MIAPASNFTGSAIRAQTFAMPSSGRFRTSSEAEVNYPVLAAAPRATFRDAADRPGKCPGRPNPARSMIE